MKGKLIFSLTKIILLRRSTLPLDSSSFQCNNVFSENLFGSRDPSERSTVVFRQILFYSFLCGDKRFFEKISFLSQLRGEGGRGNRKRETRDKRGAKRDEIRVMRDERQETRDEQ